MSICVYASYDLSRNLRLAGDRLVVIYFSAKWCGPCVKVGPEVEKLQYRYDRQVVILKIDVDDCSSLAHAYGITSIPTFVFLRHQREVDRVTGCGANELARLIKNYM